MPKGVDNKNNNEKSKSRSIKSKNDNQPTKNLDDEIDLADTITDNKSEKQSSENSEDLTSTVDQSIEENEISKPDDSDIEKRPNETSQDSDLNLFLDDVRDSIKEKILSDSSNQVLPGSGTQKRKQSPKFIQNIDNWMYGKIRNPFSPYKHVVGSTKRKRSPIRIIFLILLLAILGYVLVIAGKTLTQLTPVVVPTNTPVPTYSIPTPYSVQFPGGWTFFLGTSASDFPDWKPVQAEWFKDTAICKLIAIPWSKQIDAVYKTLEPGEELILTMSNEDESIYQIETLETALVNNIISKLDRNSPCMIIYLYRESTSTAQLLISSPPIP